MSAPVSALRLLAREAEQAAGVGSWVVGGTRGIIKSVVDDLVKAQTEFAEGLDTPHARAYAARFFDPTRTGKLEAGTRGEPSPGKVVEDAQWASDLAAGANSRARQKMPWLPESKVWTPDFVPLTGPYVQDTNYNLIESILGAQSRGLFEHKTEDQIRSELGHLRALATGGPHRGQWSAFGAPTVAAMRGDVNATMGILDALAYQKLFEQRLLSQGKARTSARAAELAGDVTMLSSTLPIKKRIAQLRAVTRAGKRGGH